MRNQNVGNSLKTVADYFRGNQLKSNEQDTVKNITPAVRSNPRQSGTFNNQTNESILRLRDSFVMATK